MNPILRNSLAIIAGWISGSLINMGLIQLGHMAIPIEGIDPSDMAALAEVMPKLDYQYFIFPFLAHALGTLAGAFVAGLIAIGNKMKLALGIGILFLIGGIAVNYMLPGPTWFAALDILVAYIPMAWIGGSVALKISKQQVK